jgi:acyl CoA:acetate/3-ketoacid CoA transferase beta subunit
VIAHNNHDVKHELRSKISKRAALEIKNGMFVNLGIGIPTLCVNYLPSDIKATF